MNLAPAISSDFAIPTLRDRATLLVALDEDILLFRGFDQGTEYAVVGLRMESGEDFVEIEEIFVASEWRGRGVGREVMALIDVFARTANRHRIKVWAEPLDDDSDDAKEALVRWYGGCGFASVGPWDELEKMV